MEDETLESGATDFRKLRANPIESREQLHRHLQIALRLELSLLPVYLTAQYSLPDKTSDVFQFLRDAAWQQLSHIITAANLLISIGGTPKMMDREAFVYPLWLPNGVGEVVSVRLMPITSLHAFSQLLDILNSRHSNVQVKESGRPYTSIGQLYGDIQRGFVMLTEQNSNPEQPSLYHQSKALQQRNKFSSGKNTRSPIVITDAESTRRAIDALTGNHASHDAYGMRFDRVYGPLDTGPTNHDEFNRVSTEIERFKRFSDEIKHMLPDIEPLAPASLFSNLQESEMNVGAKKLIDLFDLCYMLFLRGLKDSFCAGHENTLFQVGLPMMQRFLPKIAEVLQRTPVFQDGEHGIGPCATPLFQYISNIEANGVDAVLAHIMSVEGQAVVRYHTRLSLTCLNVALEALCTACLDEGVCSVSYHYAGENDQKV